MTTRTGYVKQALYRDDSIPMGIPSPLHVVCNCGHRVEIVADINACAACATAYDCAGWITDGHPTTTPKQAFAWVHLQRLGGCHYKVPIARRGSLVVVKDPQGGGSYRVNVGRFDAGEKQFRDSWIIEQWSERAERTMEAEENWQT